MALSKSLLAAAAGIDIPHEEEEQMNYEKHEFNIFPEIKKDSQAYEQLKESIQSGYRKEEPLVIFEGKILDGWNRYLICKEIDITATTRIVNFSRIEAIEYIKGSNARRDLTNKEQRTAIYIELHALEMLEVAENERRRKISESMQGKPSNNSKDKKLDGGHIAHHLTQEKPKEPTQKTRETISKATGLNEKDVQKLMTMKNKDPEKFEQVKSGEKNLGDIKKEEKKETQQKQFQALKEKENLPIVDKYDVIVIDPPWQMEKIERDVAPNQVGFDYPTMTIDDIKNIKIPAEDNCHLFMWTTQKYLPASFEILSAWGFKYVFTMVWHKNGGFQPFNLPMYNCEFILYGRKGTPSFVDLKQFFTCFKADRKSHSEKPAEFYELLRRVTAGKKLDMFNRREIEGFDTWGNESK